MYQFRYFKDILVSAAELLLLALQVGGVRAGVQQQARHGRHGHVVVISAAAVAVAVVVVVVVIHGVFIFILDVPVQWAGPRPL